ncbi:hypothetical protein VNO78_22106 [Psophocarpus tetragonolobus]|uniref:Uncharacterized protein n=1 Tax=Psophocarpus tetragonolobus TaxID=3891 RepID=A0AAN9XIW1_PSOTE
MQNKINCGHRRPHIRYGEVPRRVAEGERLRLRLKAAWRTAPAGPSPAQEGQPGGLRGGRKAEGRREGRADLVLEREVGAAQRGSTEMLNRFVDWSFDIGATTTVSVCKLGVENSNNVNVYMMLHMNNLRDKTGRDIAILASEYIVSQSVALYL